MDSTDTGTDTEEAGHLPPRTYVEDGGLFPPRTYVAESEGEDDEGPSCMYCAWAVCFLLVVLYCSFALYIGLLLSKLAASEDDSDMEPLAVTFASVSVLLAVCVAGIYQWGAASLPRIAGCLQWIRGWLLAGAILCQDCCAVCGEFPNLLRNRRHKHPQRHYDCCEACGQVLLKHLEREDVQKLLKPISPSSSQGELVTGCVPTVRSWLQSRSQAQPVDNRGIGVASDEKRPLIVKGKGIAIEEEEEEQPLVRRNRNQLRID